ncbi:hypothetical protein Q1W73_02390 [Asticcacaulis sp. ZE23SCel15]|uniref:hypothetical protein n=1 Tax=Asticcacaulis sp. ZE23SCel15 TaxID=3059027 RepID=UPI00265D7CF6|nr:hypothetical protein [Asticcacaulis sp. ZE23SCel15]WKL57850.1 hypothetical protein Q1W73_02390 [Asticcacaulis sp. ZE23SCel15]
MTETITVEQALKAGRKSIYGLGQPLFFMCSGQTVLVLIAPETFGFIVPEIIKNLSICLGLLGIPLMWLIWSTQTPRWKLWAYARVDDLVKLKTEAIREGLIWPDGHLFEKTEMCSPDMRKKILELEGRYI